MAAANDLAVLLGAAVRAAVLAKAPRRTTTAVAAAVTGALLQELRGSTPARPAAGAASKRAPRAPDGHAASPEAPASTVRPELLVAALRESRRAKRRRNPCERAPDDVLSGDPVNTIPEKLRMARRARRLRQKERSRAAKQAASDALKTADAAHSQLMAVDDDIDAGAAGRSESGGGFDVVPALAPAAPAQAQAMSPLQPGGDIVRQLPPSGPGHLGGAAQSDRESSGSAHTLRASSASVHTLCASAASGTLGGSVAHSTGNRRPGPYAAPQQPGDPRGKGPGCKGRGKSSGQPG